MSTLRQFGLDLVGDVPWGTHLCQFYETRDDLVDILVPYFAEGLRSNEACMWVTSEPLEAEEATAALAQAVPDLDRFIRSGQFKIIPYDEWYLKDGTFDQDRVLQGWIDAEEDALAQGFEGVRLSGNTMWIERSLWDAFVSYEEAINTVIGGHHMLVLCTYSLAACSGGDVIDVVQNHEGTIIKKGGTWTVVEETQHRKKAEHALTQELSVTTSLAHLTEHLLAVSDIDSLTCAILDEAKRLTGSTHGFVAVIDPATRDVISYGHTEMLLNECGIAKEARQIRFPIGPDGAYHGLGMHALNLKEGFYTNDPASHPAATGTPEGHVPIEQFCAVPSFIGDEVVGEIALANPGREYADCDITVVERLADIFGLAVLRQRSDEALHVAHKDVQALYDKLQSTIAAQSRLTKTLLAPSSDMEALTLAVLDEAKQLTDSAHGFVAVIDPRNRDLIAYGHTRMMLNECAIPEAQRPIRFPIGPDGKYHALSTHAINEKKGFFTNEPAAHPASTGTPEGHVTLEQFLAVPALIGGEAVGEVALANPGRDYTMRDVEVVERLAEVYALTVVRAQAEERLRATSLYARNLIEASLDPLVTINAKGIITDVNKATEEVTGYLRHELIGTDFSDYFTEPAEARKGYKQAFANGFVKDYPLRIRHRSGTHTDVLYNATVYRNEAGDVQGVFAAARDVTERKRAEEQLRATSLYARSLIEASLDPLVTISVEGKITDVNKATEEVTGCSRDELIGSDFNSYFTEPEKARAGYQQVFANGFVRDYPLAIKSTSGRIVDVLYNAAVYRDEAGEVQGVFAAARDVTDRKRAEEELQRYSGHLEAIVEERTARLKDAERLAGIGQTATMIGHDLRNPLQGLQYMVDLQKLRFERTPPEERGTDEWVKEEAFLDKVGEQVIYMDKIVSDLQDYARPVEPQLEMVDLSTLIDGVLQQTPHDKVHVTTALDDISIAADQYLIRRVFTNLILNALQAIPGGGTLTISAKAVNESVIISVHDTGAGVPQEMRDKLFLPLTTGKAKGTGLGLAVVKRIVEAHNGTIEFASEEGKGTTFTVTLPQTSE